MKLPIGCALLFAAISQQAASQIQVTFSGDTTKIWDKNIEWWCAARFVVTANVVGDSIFVVERDTMPLTDCTCYYALCSSIVGLGPGTYHAVVSRQYRIPAESRDTTASTGSITFTVPGGTRGSLAISLYQSTCSQVPVSVTDQGNEPVSYAMVSNYPNPFNPVTVIRYAVPKSSHVSVSIFDVRGRQIRVLAEGTRQAGSYELYFDASGLSSGTYICRLIVGGQVLSAKMLLVK
jgi:hypothetical protein